MLHTNYSEILLGSADRARGVWSYEGGAVLNGAAHGGGLKYWRLDKYKNRPRVTWTPQPASGGIIKVFSNVSTAIVKLPARIVVAIPAPAAPTSASAFMAYTVADGSSGTEADD